MPVEPPTPPSISVYVGPAVSRWAPTSCDDVRELVADPGFKENHWVDAKVLLAKTNEAKSELAKDLASFANDGGMLLVGVREHRPTGTFNVEPVELNGLAEFVDQIARYRCDPPLFTYCRRLNDLESLDKGVLLIVIPPSPLAPHQVESRYYGRSDTTKTSLTDAEIARLHAIRETRRFTAQQLIDSEIARDPIPRELRELGHLYLVAQPLSSPPDLVTNLINQPELSELVAIVSASFPTPLRPNWDYFEKLEPRANGSGFRSYGMFGRQFNPADRDIKESAILDLEVDDDGRLSLFAGGITWTGQRVMVDRPESMILDQNVRLLTHCFVMLAGLLGSRAAYSGSWMLAIGLTDLKGKVSSRASNTMSFQTPFSAETYVRGTEAATQELVDNPTGVADDRLLLWLRRALGRL